MQIIKKNESFQIKFCLANQKQQTFSIFMGFMRLNLEFNFWAFQYYYFFHDFSASTKQTVQLGI